MRALRFIVLLFSACFLLSCEDILVEDIENQEVQLLTPMEGVKYNKYTQTFWWKVIDGVEKYKVQIVEGRFDSIVSLVADTNVTGNKYEETLYPGFFTWRVQGVNSGYETPWSTGSFLIDSASIEDQYVSLQSPTSDSKSISVDFNIIFSWKALPGVREYIIEVDEVDGNFTDATLLLRETVPATNTRIVNLRKVFENKFGEFKWRVRGVNAGVYSQFSDVGNFVISPGVPVIQAPIGGVAVPNPVPLQWEPLEGIPKYYVNATDSLGYEIPGFPIEISDTKYSADFGAYKGKVNWYLHGIDGFDNHSGKSITNSFIVQ